MNTEFIDQWANVKAQIKRLNAQCETYRKRADKLMRQQNTNILQGNNYSVVKRTTHITRIKKSDMPQDLWHQYSTVNSHQAFYVKKN
tara:strand:- start:220 stop:480 length:261 start_codon:yes stop_codon:yes gene_type:complete